MGAADVPQRSQRELDGMSTDIVLGVVESRSMTETLDPASWQERSFEYGVRVEETLKGGLERGNVIRVKAVTRSWVGTEPMPPSDTGHDPLPLAGELAKFHLVFDEGGSTYSVVLPNGVELAQGAEGTDPRRRGDLPEVVEAPSEEEGLIEEASRDPFGWDVLLVLLSIPLVVGALRQKGRPRWILLGISTVMLMGAAAIVLV